MKILVVEPFFTGSHALWLRGYKERSSHEIKILSLEGRNWKWRMRCGAVTLARLFMEGSYDPDLIVATDMLDLTIFLALTRGRTANTATAIYFHENQFGYPWSPRDSHRAERSAQYGFINYASALTADRVFFNSKYHMDSFILKAEEFLKSASDFRELDSIERIREKSRILYLALDLTSFDSKPDTPREGPALILWNHRWEYDKNPRDFFRALYEIKAKGLDFRLAVLGEHFTTIPKEFEEARLRLSDNIVQFGFLKDPSHYALWLRRADLLPVTSNHDFFGASVVEALYCGVFPILPHRLAYPEHLPPDLHGKYLYKDFRGLLSRMESFIKGLEGHREVGSEKRLKETLSRYSWERQLPLYDQEMEAVVIDKRN